MNGVYWLNLAFSFNGFEKSSPYNGSVGSDAILLTKGKVYMRQNTNGPKRKYVWLLIIIVLVIAIIYASRDRQQHNNPAQSDKAVLNSKYEKKSLETIIKHQNDNSDQSEGNESTGQDVIMGDTDKQSTLKLESSSRSPSFPQAAQSSTVSEQPTTSGWQQKTIILATQAPESAVTPTPVHIHDWQPVESVIHHDEEKHAVHQDAVTLSVYIVDSPRETHDVIKCLVCGTEYTSTDEWLLHCASAQDHGNYTVVTVEDHPEQGHYEEQIIQPAYDEFVIDTAAWDEIVIVGYRCSTCGQLQ